MAASVHGVWKLTCNWHAFFQDQPGPQWLADVQLLAHAVVGAGIKEFPTSIHERFERTLCRDSFFEGFWGFVSFLQCTTAYN